MTAVSVCEGAAGSFAGSGGSEANSRDAGKGKLMTADIAMSKCFDRIDSEFYERSWSKIECLNCC